MDPDPDADPDPALFVIDLQDANKKLIFVKCFSAYYFENTQKVWMIELCVCYLYIIIFTVIVCFANYGASEA